MASLRKLRFIWVYPLAAWLVLTARTTDASLRAGIALALLGEAARFWANGYVGHRKVNTARTGPEPAKIGSLITAGPYAYVRNPLYVGTVLIGAGFCVAVQAFWGALGALLVFVLTYAPKVRQEEALILSEWGDEFAAYQRAVPRWVPTWRRYPRRNGTWSWQGIDASKEVKTVLWVAVAMLLLYFWEEFRQARALFSGTSGLKHVVWAVVLVALMATDGLMEWRRRCRPRVP